MVEIGVEINDLINEINDLNQIEFQFNLIANKGELEFVLNNVDKIKEDDFLLVEVQDSMEIIRNQIFEKVFNSETSEPIEPLINHRILYDSNDRQDINLYYNDPFYGIQFDYGSGYEVLYIGLNENDAIKRLNYHIQDMAENIIGFGVVKAKLEDLNIKEYMILPHKVFKLKNLGFNYYL